MSNTLKKRHSVTKWALVGAQQHVALGEAMLHPRLQPRLQRRRPVYCCQNPRIISFKLFFFRERVLPVPIMASQPTINVELERAIEAAKESFSRLPNGDEIFEKCKTGQISIVDIAKDARESFGNRISTKRLQNLQKCLECLQGLSSVIDTAVQTKADFMCPVWAPIKFVLKVSDDHSRATDQILLMLDTITQSMGHASLYKDLESDGDIDAALLALFKDVVDHCIQATEFFRRSAFKRFRSMLAKPYKYGFSQMRDRIREHTTHLHRLVMEKEAIRAAQAREEDRKVRCQTWLRPCSMNEVHQRHIRTRISGTCEWIQSNQTFSEWKTAPSTMASEKILAISGVHGCGKSVLASAIVEGLKAEGHNVVLFSFSTTDVDRQTEDSMVRFLLSRLLSRGFRESVDGIYTMFSDERHPSTSQLWELLQDLLRQETQTAFYIFDGLDEASDDHQDIVNRMLEVLEHCPESKCLFLGRPQGFDKITESKIPHNRRIEMDQTLTQPDIEIFIDTNIEKLDTLQDQGLRAHASETLKRNCESMFLWADLMVKDLSHAYSKHDAMKKLENLPRDLEAAYQQIFSRLKVRLYPNEQLLLRNILTFVVTARRPLTPLELSWAHALQQASSNATGKAAVHDFLLDKPEERILHVGRDFVSIYDGRVHLNHSSIKDFVTRSHPCEQSNSEMDLEKFQVDLRRANALLADLCLDYLDMEDHGFPIREPGTLDTLRKLHPFMEYASYNFYFHVQSSRGGFYRMMDKLRSLVGSTRVISCLDHLTSAWGETEFDLSLFLVDSIFVHDKDAESVRELAKIFLGQVTEEIVFRSKEFGADDARTEHLKVLVTALSFFMGSPIDLERFWDVDHVDSEPVNGNTSTSTSSSSYQGDTLAAANVVRILQSAQIINSQRQVSIIQGMLSQMGRKFLDPLHMIYKLFLTKALSLPVYAVLGISMLYHDIGKAEQAYQLCLKILPRVEGCGTLEESWTYLLTGCCLRILGRHDEAITYLIRGFGRREINPALTRCDLGIAFRLTYRFEEGVSTLRSIMAKDKKRYGNTHACVVISEYWIGCLLGHQGQHEESFACYRRALKMTTKTMTTKAGVINPQTLKCTLVEMMEQLDQSGFHRDTISLFEENCVDTLEGHHKWFQADINSFLGLSCFRMRKEHENFLPRALNHFEKAYLTERECRGKPVLGILHDYLFDLGEEVDTEEKLSEYNSLLEQAWGFSRGCGRSDVEQELRCFREALDHLVRNVTGSEDGEEEREEEEDI